MILEPFKYYVVTCKGEDGKEYRWHLKMEPEKNAWKLVYLDMQKGDVIKGFSILAVEKKSGIRRKKYNSENQFFDDIGFAVEPSYEQSYRCPYCDGMVLNNICTSCRIDWDS